MLRNHGVQLFCSFQLGLLHWLKIHVNSDIVYCKIAVLWALKKKLFDLLVGTGFFPGPFLCSNYGPILWCSDIRVSTYTMSICYYKLVVFRICPLLIQNYVCFFIVYFNAVCLNMKYDLIFPNKFKLAQPWPGCCSLCEL